MATDVRSMNGSWLTSYHNLDARLLSIYQQWVHSGNMSEIKAARKGTGHPTSQCRWINGNYLFHFTLLFVVAYNFCFFSTRTIFTAVET